MSSNKEFWADIQEQEKAEWINERLGGDVDEESDDWIDLAHEYDLIQEGLRDEAEARAEYEWLKTNSNTLTSSFQSETRKLRAIIDEPIDVALKETVFKMAFAHSVTLLESYLSDTIKKIIISSPTFLNNAIKNVDELKKAKFGLDEIAGSQDGALGLVLKELSKLLYHNIPKIKRVYESVLNANLDVRIGDVDKITSTRHDIVHRNGMTLQNTAVSINHFEAERAITTIEIFVSEFEAAIKKAQNNV